LSDGVEVTILHHTVQQLDANGQRLRTVQFTDYTGEQVRDLYRDVDDLRSHWVLATERESIIKALEERGISFEHLAAVMGQPDADPFDLLSHLAFGVPVHTRHERADRLRREQNVFFARFAPDARAILETILDQYATYGPTELVLPDVLHLPSIAERGNVGEISSLFGGPKELLDAMKQLQDLLYAA
jgi:type I restriction enzyme, R subunit